MGAAVKCSAASYNAYCAYVYLVTTTPTFVIAKRYSGGYNILASQSLDAPWPPYYTISLEWNLGHLTAILNGAITLEYDDSEYASGAYAGFSCTGNNFSINDITIVTGTPPSLSVSPEVIPNYGACSTVTLSGNNTSWTSGTPGSPTFTVNHGTIDGQEVIDSDTAELTYCPGDYLGPVIFTDPSTGNTATALVSSDPEVVNPPSGSEFDDDFIATANATVRADNRGLPTLQSIIVPAAHGWSDVYLQEAIADIWYSHFRPEDLDPTYQQPSDRLAMLWQWLSGSEDPPTGPWTDQLSMPVTYALRALIDRADALKTEENYNLASVISLIWGTGGYDLTQIKAAIDAISAPDLSTVIDAVEAARGTSLPTIRDVLDLLGIISTTSNYTLGDVLTAIAAIPGSDLSPITDKLDLIQPSTSYTLTTLAAQLDGLATSLGTINDKLDAITTTLGNLSVSVTAKVPPVVAPTDEPTLGTPVALAEDIEIDVPMAGIIVDVVDKPSGVKVYPVGDFEMIFRAGYCAFINPMGYVEEPQYLSFTKGVYTPKTCTQAIGVLVKPNQGQTGWVTPFTIPEE